VFLVPKLNEYEKKSEQGLTIRDLRGLKTRQLSDSQVIVRRLWDSWTSSFQDERGLAGGKPEK